MDPFHHSKKIAIKGYAKTATNTAPTVATVIPDQTATAATAFSYAFPDTTFSDADSDTLTYTATKADGTALPSWLAFTASTRTFSGTPQAADVETVSVKVTASDGNGGASVSDTFAIVDHGAADTTNRPDGGRRHGSYRTRLRRRPQRSAMRFRPPRSATQTATR